MNDHLEKARRARHAAGQPSAKNVDELIQNAKLGLPPAQVAAVRAKLLEMPESCRRAFLKAVSGRSRTAGVKAYCLEGGGWNRGEVRQCTAKVCPLYAYRPFRN